MRKVTQDEIATHIKTHEKKIYRLIFSYVKNDADTKDILQDAIIKAMKHPPLLYSSNYVSTWFYRVVVNTCLDHLRRKKYVVDVDEITMEDFHRHDKDYLMQEQLQHILDQLPVAIKTVIVLRFFEDLKLEEISYITKAPLSTVKSRLYKGLHLLKVQMEDEA